MPSNQKVFLTRYSSLHSLLLSLTAVASLSVSSALAQDNLRLEEIIVTAEKREQALQDVPISISAFDEGKLEKYGIDEIEDIGANVPNLFLNSFNNDPTTVRLFIRGIGQNDAQITQDPSVALYLDGVYIGTSIGSGVEAMDLQRIEVLRGPQGTLYGRNATGGAVNLISARPTTDGFSFKQSITGGNLDLFKAKTVLNIPVTDKLAVKLVGLTSDRDGVVENNGLGEDFGVEDRRAGRFDLRFLASDQTTVDYSFDYSDIADTQRLEQIRGGAEVAFPVAAPFDFNTVNPLIPPGEVTVVPQLTTQFVEPPSGRRLDSITSAREIEETDLQVFGHALNISHEINDSTTFKSITAIREFELIAPHDGTPMVNSGIPLAVVASTNVGFNVGDLLGGVAFPVSSSVNSFKFEQISQEFQFVGSHDSEIGAVDYVAGLYLYEDEATLSPTGVTIAGPRLESFASTQNRSQALYGQATITPDWNESLHVTVGARYSQDERDGFRINENTQSFVDLGGPGVVVGANYNKDFSQFNPSLTLAYDVTDEQNIYAKVVTGYKSGGTSQRSANPVNFAGGFSEEEITSYELGYKGSLLDGRASVAAAAFFMDIDGFQASIQTGPTAGDRDFFGIDNTEIKGVEIDVTLLLFEGLVATVGYGHLDTELGADNSSGLQSGSGTPLATTFTDSIAYAPENSVTASLDYVMSLDLAELGFFIGYSYQDGSVTSINVADDAPLDDRGLIDANISLRGIEVGAGDVSLSLWGKNLTDQEYRIIDSASLAGQGISSWATYGDPRTYGLTLTYEYQ